jgi:hypothetical protein
MPIADPSSHWVAPISTTQRQRNEVCEGSDLIGERRWHRDLWTSGRRAGVPLPAVWKKTGYYDKKNWSINDCHVIRASRPWVETCCNWHFQLHMRLQLGFNYLHMDDNTWLRFGQLTINHTNI